MSKAIDELREHFNQRPVPNSKVIIEERNKVNAMIDAIESENAKLRELVRKYGEYTDQDRCEGCACKSKCNDGDVDECWQLTEIRRLARELGVNAE